MFVFALGEAGSITDLIKALSDAKTLDLKSSVQNIYYQLSSCNIVFSTSMIEEMLVIGLEPQLLMSQGTFFDFEKDSG